MLANLTASIPPPDEADSVVAASTIAISAQGLGKRYKLYASPWHRAAEWASLGKGSRHEDFWALKDVNFSVEQGKSLGIIGVNGAGKSTLLKILTGCLSPTEGTFEVKGRILSLLELGTGMNHLLTGRQNVINGSELLALPYGYAQQKMADIESFAELGEFFDLPVRLYSTGMVMRLAFSMFVALEPDVFIVDEALSVGDIFFQQKCVRRLTGLRERGTTLLFVSHDLGAVEALCDQVLVLHHGRQEHFGDKVKGINLYYSLAGSLIGHQPAPVPQSPARNEPAPSPAPPPSLARSANHNPLPPIEELQWDQLPWSSPDEAEEIESGQIKIDGICLRNGQGEFSSIVQRGQDMDVLVRMRIAQDIPAVNFGVTLFDRFHQLLFAQGWTNAQLQPLSVKKGETVYAGFRIRMDVWGGEFVLALAASEALADAQSPTGWNQSYGGAQYHLLPRSAVVTVAAPMNPTRVDWYGPANLRTTHRRCIIKQD